MLDMLVEQKNFSIEYSVYNIGQLDALNVVVTHVPDQNLDLVAGPEEFRIDKIAA